MFRVWPWILVCLTVLHAGVATAAPKPLQSYFNRSHAGFILYDMQARRPLLVLNQTLCRHRFSPCSTFKVPLAVMAVDQGLVTEHSPVFPWDGHRDSIDSWNHDQTPRSWLANSVVWVSQQLTRSMGMARVRGYLSQFAYGNQDTGGGLTRFWVMSTLTVSPFEQVRFTEQLWRETLPVSERAMAITRRLLPSLTSPHGWTMAGKTGTGFLDTGHSRQQGWYVGHLQHGPAQFLVVAYYADDRTPTKSYAGPHARNVCVQILRDRGYW